MHVLLFVAVWIVAGIVVGIVLGRMFAAGNQAVTEASIAAAKRAQADGRAAFTRATGYQITEDGRIVRPAQEPKE